MIRSLTPMRTPVVTHRGCLRRYGGGSQSLVRLVCFPWAGGGASAYRRFASHLLPTIELLAVQYPGREDRFHEGQLRRMGLIVHHLLDDLAPRGGRSDRPMVFFGHSMGALVAYETARALQERYGYQLQALIVSGSGSPDTQGTYTRCPFMASLDEFIADIRRLGGTPREILEDRAMMQALLPALRADYEVLDTYVSPAQSAVTLSCPIIVCAGDQDPSVSADIMAAWRRYTTGAYQLHWFSGNHFYLHAQPQILACRLQKWIAAIGPLIGNSGEPAFSHHGNNAE